MNQQTQPLHREHNFYVSIAKFLFQHPEHGVVAVRDPIKITEAQRYGLSPLILYGLTVAGLPIQWMSFTPLDQPKAFRDVLLEAWRNAGGLRGRPDILRINRHLATASPELPVDMAKNGVQVVVADAKDKSLSVSLRSAQHYSRWLQRKHDGEVKSVIWTIQALCRDAQYDHDLHVRVGGRGRYGREVEDRFKQWLALPVQGPATTMPGGLDWKPGPWLSSWEASLPPDQPRYFNFDGFGSKTWLLTGENASEGINEDDDFWADDDIDNVAEIAKNLVACWPNPPAEIAKCVGITLRELQWFISGKASLDEQIRYDLEHMLGIEYDESVGAYVEAGPYVLMASKPQALKDVYKSISNDGKASPFEIVPRQGAADPSWRYVLMNVYREPQSIVMVPRGAKITEHLPDLLMNFDGIRTVDPEFYRDVVSTCARACREPAANIREMKDFARRYE